MILEQVCGPKAARRDEGSLDEREREEMITDLVGRLRAEGAPQGTWLVEIAQARDQIATVDSLLRRLSAAIIDSMPKAS